MHMETRLLVMMTFKVASRRWNHFDFYQIEITSSGWLIGFMGISGECDPTGHPILFENFDHDGINYPAHFGEYLKHLWQIARSKNWNEKKIQPKLNVLSKWVLKTELSSPKRGIWEHY